jgi:hypothetical protein
MRICKPNLGTLFAVVVAVCAVLPVSAGAYATLEGPPVYSSAPGLPDGRVYELVSPADDNGNEAGASALAESFSGHSPAAPRYSVASAEGDSVLFEGTGPMGEVASPDMLMFVATRTGSGWETRSLLPSPLGTKPGFGALEGYPAHVLMSSDFSKSLVTAKSYALAPGMPAGCFEQLYLMGSDPFVPAAWVTPSGNCEGIGTQSSETGDPVGGTPDLSTVYFAYHGKLLPEDSVRSSDSWGFYEESEGMVREAGVLPSDSLDPLGAVPAVSLGKGSGSSIEDDVLVGNQVSADGSRAFFVSPNPEACEQNGSCATDPPELYVREDGTHSVLVSKDTLLPETEGLPTAAPHGAISLNKILVSVEGGRYNEPYVLASVDGSQAFFQSEDRLTSAAPEGPPGNTSVKTYDFDVNTGSLTYLPGVTGKLVGTDTGGSSLVFVRPAIGSSPAEVGLWKAGSEGGSVTPITQLPGSEEVEPVRLSSNGSVVVFTTPALIPGFNNGGASIRSKANKGVPNEDIYRYDAASNTLGCVSCSPAGVAPSWASMSEFHENAGNLTGFTSAGVVDERGISADGDRIFFQTAAPLVPQDENTDTAIPGIEHIGTLPQGVDVYEWENGVVYLLSSGKSDRDSYFLDNSESGNDVFFATAEGLVSNDTDGGYSVYDVRVPRPGDNPLPGATPCEGPACQGPPRVQLPLAAPASATFSGIGNPTPEAVSAAPSKAVVKKVVKCKRGYVKKKDKCVERKSQKRAKARKSSHERRAAS